MVEGNLNTTNLLLGIMAAVSVLQALLLVAVGVMAWKLYGQTMETVRGIEQRQVAPLVAKVDAILGDVKGITARIGAQTERVDSAISSTIDRVDETAGRVRYSVAHRVNRVIGLVSGLRAVVGHMFNGQTRATTP